MPLIKLACVGGPANGDFVALPLKDPIVRVPATHVPDLVGVYRALGGTEGTGPRRLRFDYAVEFEWKGEHYSCNEVLAGGVSPASDDSPDADAVIRWVVRVGSHSCDADAPRPDDFTPGSDFIARMVSAAERHGLHERPAPPTTV